MARITFQGETIKEMQVRLGQAFQAGNLRLVRRLAVLVAITQGERLPEVMHEWRLSHQTVYTWLKDFIEKRWVFFEDHRDLLTVYQLPSYSPDYNLIEQVWRKVKKQAAHNRYFSEFVQLIQAVNNAFATLDAHPDDILHHGILYQVRSWFYFRMSHV